MNQRPIGYIDSGVGGLSIVKEAMRRMPEESVLYFGDTARCPYGELSQKQIIKYGREIAYFLVQKNIKALVIACNTITSTALFSELEEILPIPVLGVIDSGCKAAYQATDNKKIAVVGTEQTVNSDAHLKTLKDLDNNIQVKGIACPKWVKCVEEGNYLGHQAEKLVEDGLNYLQSFDYDALILACTHFPFLEPLIAERLGEEINIIDPSVETIKQLQTLLSKHNLTAPAGSAAFHHFYTTGNEKYFSEIVSDWLGEDWPVESVGVNDLSNSLPEVLVATHNAGKAHEYQNLFNQWGYQVKTLLDYPDMPEVEETGETFAENALIKAQSLSEMTDGFVIADDSGLMVDALDGAPGIYSARYSGEPKSDDRNNKKLLSELKNVPNEERTARFHTTIVAVKPGKEPLVVSGEVTGVILRESAGHNGFGYDPLFFIPAYAQTMAEMPTELKNKISHRGRSFKELQEKLPHWLADRK